MVVFVLERTCKFLALQVVLADQYRFKAIALGADFIQLGRPILWGLAHEGEKGVRHVLKCLLAEFDLTVGLSGCQELGDVNSTFLEAT